MSIAITDIWAAGYVRVFYTVDDAMWIVGWWFLCIPVRSRDCSEENGVV
jgi:hypothetical protein